MPESREETAARTGSIDPKRLGHRECMEVVAEIERSVDRTPDRGWVADLVERLPRLREALIDHFADEESGTLYGTMPLTFPHLAERFEALKHEHPRLLAHVDNLLERAGHLDDPKPYELRELDARMQLLLARIRRHEAQENELVFEAVWHEIGVGD